MTVQQISLDAKKVSLKKAFYCLLAIEVIILGLSTLRPEIGLLLFVPAGCAVLFVIVERNPEYSLFFLVFAILLGPISAIPIGGKVPELFYVDVILLLVFFTLLIRSLLIRKGVSVAVTSIEMLFIAFLAFSFLTIVQAVDFFRGLASLRNYLTGFIVLVLTLNFIKNSGQLRKIFWSLIIWGMLLSMIQLRHILQQGNILLTVLTKNIHLSWGSSNYIAAFYALLIPLTLSMTFTKSLSSSKKLALLSITLLMIISMFLTGSRGAVVAVIAGLLVLLWRFRSWRTFLAFLFFCIIAGVMISSIPSSQIIWQGLVGYQTSPSVLSRVDLWQESLRIFRQHPILGVGLGNINYHVQLAGSLFMRSHNLVLELLSEIGIVGFLLFAGLLFKVVRIQVKNCRRMRDDFQTSLAWGILAGTATALTHSMVEPNISSYMFSIMFWMVVGLSIRQIELRKATVEEEREKIEVQR